MLSLAALVVLVATQPTDPLVANRTSDIQLLR